MLELPITYQVDEFATSICGQLRIDKENALIDLLKKKEAGEKIEPAKEILTPQVVNLMDALRASIDAEKKKAPAPSTPITLLKEGQPEGVPQSVRVDHGFTLNSTVQHSSPRSPRWQGGLLA